MNNSVFKTRSVFCALGLLAVISRGADIPVDLSATVGAVRAFSGSTPITPSSIFQPGQVVTGNFIFNSGALDQYPGDPILGFYLHGLISFDVRVPSAGLHWSSSDGQAQIENDYMDVPSSQSINDRVRFVSYIEAGLVGSQLNGNSVLGAEIDVYEFSAVPPTPIHPLLTSKIPSAGSLVFDVGHLQLQWYEGQNLISTILDFTATPVPEPSEEVLAVIGGLFAWALYRGRSRCQRRI